MKVSLNLAQQFSNVDLKSIPRDELLQKMGAQLGAIEEVIEWGPRYDGIVVARVVSCEKHPNADKGLSVCLIDDGGAAEGVERDNDGYLQVVCGASNVRETLLVAWIPPGVVVPSTIDKDPLKLEVREIRGVRSNGMIASPAELGISDDHDGILEIDVQDVGEQLAKPGTPLKQLYGLDDLIIDCENKMFTHRPDCFGNLGISRELAGIFGLRFQSPKWYVDSEKSEQQSVNGELSFCSKNEITEMVPRFTAQVVENVKIGPSPTWLQVTLKRVGIKPINNIVDTTNYYMHLTGQPTHAFDYDKIKAFSGGEPTIFPRMAVENEEITLLGSKTIKLSSSDIVIATDQKAVALAGVMGGAETEVDESTKNIIIEAATFNMFAIRRSSMQHGLFTDAVTRFNKGQSPLQNRIVLNKLVNDLCEKSSAKASKLYDDGFKQTITPIEIELDFVNDRLGIDLSVETVQKLLENVEFQVSAKGRTFRIIAPFWRRDIEIAEDVVEEIGRLYGYDKLPVSLPVRSSKATPQNGLFEYKKQVRAKLAGAGANEVLTYSFVHGDLLKKTGVDAEKWSFHVRNALSPNLQYYRTSLLPSLLDKVHMNLRADIVGVSDNEFAIYEIGKAHVKDHLDQEGLPTEFERLALVVAADDKTAARKYSGASYYHALEYLKYTLDIEPELVPLVSNEYPVTSPFQLGRTATVAINGDVFGVVGEFKSSVNKALKLPNHSAGFELDLEKMLKIRRVKQYKPITIFPKTQQDITLEVNDQLNYSFLHKLLDEEIRKTVKQHSYNYELLPLDIFRSEGSDQKRFTFRLWLSHPLRTLTTDETNTLLVSISEAAAQHGATRI